MKKLVKVQTVFSYFDPLQKKIEEAERIIMAAYEKNKGKVYVCWSGGKDSTILKDIALRLYPDIKVVFSNTTNELPEVLRYVKQHKNVIVVNPRMSFREVIETVGVPVISKEISQKANELKNSGGRKTQMLRYYGSVKGNSILPKKWRFLASQKFDVTAECCKILKKEPLAQWEKKNGYVPLIALMADESMLRKQLSLYGNDTNKKIYPFLKTNWNEADIWSYAERYNIRFAECYYDKLDSKGVLIPATQRTGCRDCDFGTHLMKSDKFERSRLAYPKSLEKVMNYKNNGITFREIREIAHSTPKYDLGLYGGIVLGMNVKNDIEIYDYELKTYDKSCSCCGKRKAKRDMQVTSSFVDTPNHITNRKRVIKVTHWINKCGNCGMTLVNDLHFYDLRFNVTKRVIDHIYENLDKKSCQDIVNETGLPIEDVFEIITYDYNKPIMNAVKNKRKSIWFDEDNALIQNA